MADPSGQEYVDAEYRVITPARREPIEYQGEPRIFDRSDWPLKAKAVWFAVYAGLMIPAVIAAIFIGHWIYTSLGHAWGYLPNRRAHIERIADQSPATTALLEVRDKIIRLWAPDCSNEPARNVRILVRMNLNSDGSLAGGPLLADYPGGISSIADPILKESAIRAVSAVSRGAPYDNLPKADYSFWKTVALNFDAKQACLGQ